MTMETAQTLPMRKMSQGKLYPLLKALVDILSDPAAQQERPAVWAEAHVELARLLNVPGNWETVVSVREGANSNFIQHNLGPFRMNFLRIFREQTRR